MGNTLIVVLRHCQSDQNCHFTTPDVGLRHLRQSRYRPINIHKFIIMPTGNNPDDRFLLVISQLLILPGNPDSWPEACLKLARQVQITWARQLLLSNAGKQGSIITSSEKNEYSL